jgi:hypothetical protein
MERSYLLFCGIAFAAIIACAAVESCSAHQGLAKSVAAGSLEGCTEWARNHNDAELEALCQAGRPLTEVLDLFAARQSGKDAGHD